MGPGGRRGQPRQQLHTLTNEAFAGVGKTKVHALLGSGVHSGDVAG